MSTSIPTIYKFGHISAGDTREICRPLFDSCGISIFTHGRISHDETVYGLISCPDIADYCMEKGIMLNPPQLPKNLQKLSFFFFWGDAALPLLVDNFAIRNIYHPLSYFEITPEYCEHFTFGLSMHTDHAVSALLNQVDALKKFIEYFKTTASSLLQRAEQQKIRYPSSNCFSLDQTFLEKMIVQKSRERKEIFEITQTVPNTINVKLSKQEHRCLMYIAQGKTAKECAKILGLSPRTVESYIYNMKCKLGVYKRSQLIEIFQHLNVEKTR